MSRTTSCVLLSSTAILGFGIVYNVHLNSTICQNGNLLIHVPAYCWCVSLLSSQSLPNFLLCMPAKQCLISMRAGYFLV